MPKRAGVVPDDDPLLVTCRVCGSPVIGNDPETVEEYGKQITVARKELNVEDLAAVSGSTAAVGYCSDKCLDDPKVEARMRQGIGLLSRRLGIRLEGVEEPET